ncbi:hypothetical protein EAG_10953 [Camponotus floridanus]|uniref:Uncharacterized protein n=1 Tax=Camponotus floridanus TaxID=104421 RepID=E2ALJ4_CAMFO|nr:hypothetical protein EAG_10953 [Camponotus floridanus]
MHFHPVRSTVEPSLRETGKRRAYLRRKANEVRSGEASEAREMRMENTVSGDRWWCGTPNERSECGEGRRLTYLPVAGSVGVRQYRDTGYSCLLSRVDDDKEDGEGREGDLNVDECTVTRRIAEADQEERGEGRASHKKEATDDLTVTVISAPTAARHLVSIYD